MNASPNAERLRIAVIAPPFLSIPPTKRGGTESILYELTEELVRRGHDVTLYACGSNGTSAKFEQVWEHPINEMSIDTATVETSRKLRLEMTYFAEVARRLQTTDPYDVVLNHTRGEVSFAPLTETYPAPIISTFHNIILPEQVVTMAKTPKTYAIAISSNQRQQAGDLENFVGVAYNGVDTEKYGFEAESDDYLFWIGQISSRKNPLDAIAAAKAAGRRLILAGKETEPGYYHAAVAPLVDGQQISFAGEVGMAEKVPLYQKAAALLFPTSWPEPFGLVMIEAMSCGTPVIAYPNGAVPEVIEDGRTGFIVEDTDGMTTAISRLSEIDRHACRDHVIKHFSVQATTDQHLAAITEARRRFT